MQAAWEQMFHNSVGKGRGFEGRRLAGEWGGVSCGCSVGANVSSRQRIYISFIPLKSRTFLYNVCIPSYVVTIPVAVADRLHCF